MSENKGSTLLQKFEAVLPKGLACKVYHIRTKPQKHESLHKTPKRHPTTCESHLLLVSSDDIFVFALELLLFKTQTIPHIFIAKADSSGYAKAPLREITSTFIAHIVETRFQPGVPNRICLFARAQNQYVFVDSIKNSDKHILDDYGLIKWWMRALDSISSIRAWVTVPGLSKREVERLMPSSKWSVGFPFNPDAFVQEVIPFFPDDPKSRFLDEIIVEDRKVAVEEFWESMAFRQECSLGRLTGFMWMDVQPGAAVSNDPGGVVVEGRTFQRCFDTLLREDFSSRELAQNATSSWLEGMAGVIGHQADWGAVINGTRESKKRTIPEEQPSINVLAPRKKQKPLDVNTIDSSKIRRKGK